MIVTLFCQCCGWHFIDNTTSATFPCPKCGSLSFANTTPAYKTTPK